MDLLFSSRRPPMSDPCGQAATTGKAMVDIAFWGEAVPGKTDELAALYDAGVGGFKTFLCDSAVPEYGCVHPSDVGAARPHRRTGTTLIVHAEDPDLCDAAAAAVDADRSRSRRSYRTWLDRRPAAAEVATGPAPHRSGGATTMSLSTHVLGTASPTCCPRRCRPELG